MKCSFCNKDVPEGDVYCPHCGEEVQIVPDYNPFDEMLASHIQIEKKGSQQIRRASNAELEEMRRKKRLQNKKRQELLRKRRRIAILVLIALVAIIAFVFYILYKNSYNGTIAAGNKYMMNKEYDKASGMFLNAINKEPAKDKAYVYYCDALIALEQPDKVQEFMQGVIAEQPENAALYMVYFDALLNTDNAMIIPEMLSEVPEDLLTQLDEYYVAEPEYSLDDTEIYDDVQELSLSSDNSTIYYTEDGADPQIGGYAYNANDPIQIREGNTEVKAIAVNKKGIPSQIVSKTYKVEFPMVDAPAVTPSTGQYQRSEKIIVKVPDGYEAYYTLDRTDPTEESEKYTDPIDMPVGDTLFKVVLINPQGRMSGITTRNYLYEPEE